MFKENKQVAVSHKSYRFKHPYSVAWRSIFCWLWCKSDEYKAYQIDVEQLKMDTSLENVIVSINTLKDQVRLLIENNNKLDFDRARF